MEQLTSQILAEQGIKPPFDSPYDATRYYKILLRPRLVFESRYVDGDDETRKIRSKTYIRPKTGNEIKGKLNLKFAKKQRIKKWKNKT